ncbi:MAG: hypothetical protein COB17_02230 [Sulfurimonas sp.]|nr:MAG: hypothetical protein COB17_02230 [Sulfurimonas sp.]
MYKILILSALIFSGCSYFTFNVAMCEQIAADPNQIMPEECRDYNEAEAERAFNSKKIKTSVSGDDLKFKKEE